MRATSCLLLLLALVGAVPVRAEAPFSEPGWFITAAFPAAPRSDEVVTPSEQGDIRVKRYFHEQGTTRCMLARFQYPVVPLARLQDSLYDRSITEMMKSRPGEMKANGPIELGLYTGRMLRLLHRREKTVREVRQFLIGDTLLLISAEWPGTGAPPPEVDRFLRSVAVRPEFANPRVVEEDSRWRELAHGNFRVRYDGSRWYRDPTDAEPGIFNLLRVDQLAEAQLIAESEPLPAGQTMEESVIATAKESAESVVVKRKARKNRGGTLVDELEYTVRIDGTTYVNHGYFYSGPAGAVQLRAWSTEKTYREVEGDIGELLDGLNVAGGR